jgi:prostaglandin-H2 D-isomerase / glutathione transferase
MQLRLVYFQVRAKAEPTRMALAYGGIPWIDESITSYFGEGGWPTHKPKTPWGSVPILAVDDVEIAQTPAIMRFVAGLVEQKEAGFAPSEPMLAAKCDAAFFAAEELGPVNPVVNVFKGEAFAEKKASYFETFPAKLSNLARALGDGPFFCGSRPTYGDFK